MVIVFVVQVCEFEIFGDYFILFGVDRNNIGSDYFIFMLLCGELVIVVGVKFSVKRFGLNEFLVFINFVVLFVFFKYLFEGINFFYIYFWGIELLIVLKGILNVGFIDIVNKFFIVVLQEGDVFVFFKGLVYYQINLSCLFVIVYVVFSSFNFGIVFLFVILFGIGIFKVVYEIVFKVYKFVIDKFEVLFCNQGDFGNGGYVWVVI